MQVEDIIKDNLHVVPDNTSMRKAAVLMRERDAGVLVVQQGERIVGTLSHRDLALKGYGEGCDPDNDSVAAAMAQHIVTCPLETDLTAALRLMVEEDVDALVLGEPPAKATGLVTRIQVLEVLADGNNVPSGPTPEQVKRVRGNPI